MARSVTEFVVVDFDGTVAYRPGNWSQALLDVLDAHLPDHGATLDAIRRLPPVATTAIRHTSCCSMTRCQRYGA